MLTSCASFSGEKVQEPEADNFFKPSGGNIHEPTFKTSLKPNIPKLTCNNTG